MRKIAAIVAMAMLHLAIAHPASAQERAQAGQTAWVDDTSKTIWTATLIVLGAGLSAVGMWVLASDGSCSRNEGGRCIETLEVADWMMGVSVLEIVVGATIAGLGVWGATLPVHDRSQHADLRIVPRLRVSDRGALAGLSLEF